MATYKVIQDIEAEDKLVGPLTLRQFIYFGIGALSAYLGFLLATKHAAFLLVIFVPVTAITWFFAFPWGQDQPTEVWALAKVRFFLKPRRRIWNQSGAKELVTVTAPKRVERALTNGLNLDEVQSRLNALASTIDSRGWAVKNLNVSTPSVALPIDIASDRLVAASSLPQEVSNVDVRASDDMLDAAANPIAQHFDTMINASSVARHQQAVAQLQDDGTGQSSQPAAAQGQPADFWFMNQGPVTTQPGQSTFLDAAVVTPGAQSIPAAIPAAAAPSAEEEALVDQLKAANEASHLTAAYGHLKTLKTPEQLMAEAEASRAAAAAKQPVTPRNQAAIMNLANNDDLNVATIARQAQKAQQGDDGEVVISLH